MRTADIPTTDGETFNLTLSLHTADEVIYFGLRKMKLKKKTFFQVSTYLRLPNDFDPLEYDVCIVFNWNFASSECIEN